MILISRCVDYLGWLHSTTVFRAIRIQSICVMLPRFDDTLILSEIDDWEDLVGGRIWGFLHQDRPVHLKLSRGIVSSYYDRSLRPFLHATPSLTSSPSTPRAIRYPRFQSHRIHSSAYPLCQRTPDPNGRTDRLFLPSQCATHPGPI